MAQVILTTHCDEKMQVTHLDITHGPHRFFFAVEHIVTLQKQGKEIEIHTVRTGGVWLLTLDTPKAASDLYDVLTEFLVPDPEEQVEELYFGDDALTSEEERQRALWKGEKEPIEN